MTLGGIRRMHVYTPPGYESGRDRYPVLYLLHGAGDVDESWSTVGRAGIILDNLIAAGKARPMIVVMPAGHVNGAGAASRCPIHLDYPNITISRAYQLARNNWDFDSQGIERSSNAGGMNSLDTCNPSFQLNHVRRFQLCSIAHISYGRADLQRQCELGDVDVAIDITFTLANVCGKVIGFLHLNGSTA